MESPRYEPFERFAAFRSEWPSPQPFTGLWVCGSLESLAAPCVAIVGTRAASPYGKAAARRFAAELCAAGCTVVSGLALGIDAAAHAGALDAGGRTVGILGGGHERFFPRRNTVLAESMIDRGGAVLSPFPPVHPAYPAQFLARNAIVAALSDAVLVVEAPARSGALNTAGWAAGRIPVLAVPGDVDRAHSAGCHALIRDGAILARTPADVLAEMRLPVARDPQAPAEKERARNDPVQQQILAALREGEATADQLLVRLNALPAVLLPALTLLEIGGTVACGPGALYRLA